MAKLIHFELTGTDHEALARFYATLFGWTAEPSPFVPDYHVLSDASGQIGAVMSRKFQAQPAILWFEVEDIDAQVTAIIEAGGAQAGERHTIPGQGYVQYVSDPEGNVFGLKQPLG